MMTVQRAAASLIYQQLLIITKLTVIGVILSIKFLMAALITSMTIIPLIKPQLISRRNTITLPLAVADGAS